MAAGPEGGARRAARIIAVAPVGRAAPAVVRHLHSVLEDTFGRDVIDAPGLPLAPRAYRAARGQWLATDLLDALAATRAARCERILGIAEVDLFVPDLNFVFGVADAALAAALFSLARLVAPRDPQRTLRRAATERSTSSVTRTGSGTAGTRAARCGSRTRSARPIARARTSARETPPRCAGPPR